jgi:hypothetical protein
MSQSIHTGPARSRRQWQAYVETQIGQGRPPAVLMAELTAAGVAPAEAETLLADAIGKRKTRIGVILGVSVLLFLCGLAVTFGTLASATSSSVGGTVYIWFGAVLCGLIGIGYGITQIIKSRRS